MISKKLKLNDAPPGLKIVKYLHELFEPIVMLVAVISLLLSFLTPKPGSSSRTVCIVIFAVSLAVTIALKIANRQLLKNDSYRLYDSRIIRKLDMHNLVPLTVLALLILFPFYLLIITSLKTPHEAASFEFSFWPKEGIYLGSYKEIFQMDESFGFTLTQSIVNSFVYSIIPGVIGLLTSAMAAYAFSKIHFKGSKSMYMMLLMTMMLPGCVTMGSSYLMYDQYGWTNSELPLIIPGLFGGASCVLFLREFFMGIPDGLLEAAEIDGCGKWRRFWNIMMPLARPALTAQFVLRFISGFNSYMGPLIYLNKPSGYTLQIAITFLVGMGIDISMMAAAGAFALIPMLVLYILFQKTIIQGISISSGLKG